MPTTTQTDLTLASLAEAIDGHLVLPSDAAVLAVFEPCSSGRVYLNFKDRPGDASAGFAEDTHDRLREIKAAYDPSDLRTTRSSPHADPHSPGERAGGEAKASPPT